jgi:hypothetical protein
MKTTNSENEMNFGEVVRGLIAGDFSRLAPLFEAAADGSACPIIRWYDRGLFTNEPKALAEAFSCACFNGFTQVVEYFLSKGIDPNGGINTGLNAFHWAANRGQLEVVEVAYGGTVLGCAAWSAVHEPKPEHVPIVEALLKAGANVSAAEYPSGDERVDDVLKRYGAGR